MLPRPILKAWRDKISHKGNPSFQFLQVHQVISCYKLQNMTRKYQSANTRYKREYIGSISICNIHIIYIWLSQQATLTAFLGFHYESITNPSWSHCCMNPSWIHYEATRNPVWMHHESITNPLWVHYASVLNPLWFHYESIVSPLWIRCESIMNTDGIHYESSMNPLRIHYESIMCPLCILYESIMNPLCIH